MTTSAATRKANQADRERAAAELRAANARGQTPDDAKQLATVTRIVVPASGGKSATGDNGGGHKTPSSTTPAATTRARGSRPATPKPAAPAKMKVADRIPLVVAYLDAHRTGTFAEIGQALGCSAGVATYTTRDAKPALDAKRLEVAFTGKGGYAVTALAARPAPRPRAPRASKTAS